MSEVDLQQQITSLKDTIRRHTHDDFETKKLSGVLTAVTNDTNVTGSIGSSTLTLGWTGQLAVSRGGTGQNTLASHGVLIGNSTGAIGATATGSSGQVLTSNGPSADPTFQAAPTTSTLTITVTAGETLAAGDVVRIYAINGSVNYSTDAYDMANGGIYAVLAAADDTTYGPKVFGIVTVGAAVLGTATVAILGAVTGLSGLTAGSYYYLDNHSASSSTTITQSTDDSNINLAPGGVTNTIQQIYNPTQDRTDNITVTLNGQGTTRAATISLYRHNTQLATIGVTVPASKGSVSVTWLSPIRCYKGETLGIRITGDQDALLYYKASTTPYIGGASVLSGPSTIPAGSDINFTVNEFNNFGKMATSAGSRKFNLGTAYSATALALKIQPDNALI